jgi:ABC-type transport system substrate-binding protein
LNTGRRALSWILAAFCLGQSAGAAARIQDTPKPGGVLRLRGYPELFQARLDPAQGDWTFISQHIFDGLVRLDSKLNVLPDLAEYWTISDGGRTYTFFLRKGVRFHNGRELTSADVKFSFERLLRPETPSPYAQFFLPHVVGGEDFHQGRAPDVSGFQALSRYIFEVHWRGPFYPTLSLFSMSFARILPKELIQAQGKNFFFKPVGTGAFKFSHWLRTPRLEIAGVRLDRNESYFGRKPYLEAIEYSPYFTEDQFRNREVDVMPYLWEGLARTGCQVLEGGPLNVTFLMMSCRLPPFDRARVRRALALALDKEKLAQAIASSAYVRRVTGSFVPAGLPGFFPGEIGPEPDPKQAERILQEEGFFIDKKFPTILIGLERDHRTEDVRLAGELSRQLGAVGLSSDVRYYQDLEDLARFRQPFIVRIDQTMDFPDPENFLRQLFVGPTVLNRVVNGYSSPEVTALLDEAAVEGSRTRRQELFRAIQNLLGRDIPAVPLFSNEQRVAVQPYVRGVKVPAMGLDYLDAKEIWIDRRE